MKAKFATLIMLLGLGSFAAPAPQKVELSLIKAYIPIGFDSNDNAQVVVAGSLPNTCYKVANTDFKIDETSGTVQVKQYAYRYQGVCLQVVVPFSQVVNLGIMKAQSYTLSDAVDGKALGDLLIKQATSTNPDDYLYLPANDAYIVERGTLKDLVIRGQFADRCTFFKEPMIHYYNDVIVVQPVAEHIGECNPDQNNFEFTIPLKEDLKGTFLLHVRSMNGQAINKLVILDSFGS